VSSLPVFAPPSRRMVLRSNKNRYTAELQVNEKVRQRFIIRMPYFNSLTLPIFFAIQESTRVLIFVSIISLFFIGLLILFIFIIIIVLFTYYLKIGLYNVAFAIALFVVGHSSVKHFT